MLNLENAYEKQESVLLSKNNDDDEDVDDQALSKTIVFIGIN